MSLNVTTKISVLKRDGRSARFDAAKIYRAIEAALNSRGVEDHEFAAEATDAVVAGLPEQDLDIPTIQRAV